MPNGQIRLGRPLKIVLDEVETGLSRPNSCAMVMLMMMMMTIIIIIIKLAHKPNLAQLTSLHANKFILTTLCYSVYG
jgi:ABC-type uncharacterized transport system fused permease/ATPase subunit